MRRLLALVMVFSLVLAACGGGDDDDDATPGTGTPAGSGTPSMVRGTATLAAGGTGTTGSATAAGATSTGASSTAVAASPTSSVTPDKATPTKRPATAASTPRPIATATQSASRPTATNSGQPTTPSNATPTEGTEVVITPGGDSSIELLDIGFGQVPDSEELGYGFVIRNNTGSTLDFSEYDVVAYDAGGAQLESDFGFIDLLAPGETRGIGGSIYLPDGTTATRVEVQVTSGDVATSDFPQPFSVTNPLYFGEEFFPVVTAIASGPYDRPIEDLDVHVVLYNAAGKIIGGGYDYIDFLLPGQPTGVEAYVASSEAPARVDVYVVPSGFTAFVGDFDTPGNQPTIVQSGWGGEPGGFAAGYGIIVENANSAVADYLRYQVIAYDADGRVLTVDSSYIAGLFPGERTGIGGTLYPPDGTSVARVDFQVLAQNFIASGQGNPFSVSDIAFTDDAFDPTVTATITNNYSAEIESIEVHAIAFNANGDIIGGGWGFNEEDDPVPAGGIGTAELYLTTSETPASVQVFATVSSLSDVGIGS